MEEIENTSLLEIDAELPAKYMTTRLRDLIELFEKLKVEFFLFMILLKVMKLPLFNFLLKVMKHLKMKSLNQNLTKPDSPHGGNFGLAMI